MASDRSRRLRRIALVGALLALGVWLAFFDSHSLARRIGWQHEHRQLVEENERLRAEIATLEAKLERALTDEDVERIAREEYGMRREGETVYPVESAD